MFESWNLIPLIYTIEAHIVLSHAKIEAIFTLLSYFSDWQYHVWATLRLLSESTAWGNNISTRHTHNSVLFAIIRKICKLYSPAHIRSFIYDALSIWRSFVYLVRKSLKNGFMRIYTTVSMTNMCSGVGTVQDNMWCCCTWPSNCCSNI